MAAQKNFRSAFNGFNREDVVRYLEYINTKHQDEINQLIAEGENLREQIASAQSQPARTEELEEALAEVTAERDALRAELDALRGEQEEPQQENAEEGAPEPTGTAAEELDAYRRAERIERNARERAELVYHQASGVLNEATAKVDGIADEITAKADEVMSQLTMLQVAISSSKQALQDAASIMNTIRPNI